MNVSTCDESRSLPSVALSVGHAAYGIQCLQTGGYGGRPIRRKPWTRDSYFSVSWNVQILFHRGWPPQVYTQQWLAPRKTNLAKFSEVPLKTVLQNCS